MSPRLERVRVPDTYPRERVVLGELHLLRGRLDGALEDVAHLIAWGGDEWCRVEEAARLARRALVAAVGAAPSPSPLAPLAGELRVGELRVDPMMRRQWLGDVEFELTPLSPSAARGDGRRAVPGVRQGRAGG